MTQYLQYDRETMERDFPSRSFTIQHKLSKHPLFQMERLLELSSVLPEECVEYNAGTLPVDQDPEKTPQNGLTPQETIQRIRECQSWLVLKYVDKDPEYGELLDDCLDQVEAAYGRKIERMGARESFIFVSSPNSVTPFHIDPEHNFLLQIAGSKTVHIWDEAPEDVLSRKQLEDFHAGAHRNLPYDESFEASGKTYTLQPGDGLHFPVTAPHWVENGDEVSISYSITFRSPFSEQRARLNSMNAAIRKMGITPAPIGASRMRDLSKDFVYRVGRKASSTFLSHSG